LGGGAGGTPRFSEMKIGTDQPDGGRRYLPSPGWMDTREDGTSPHSNADVTGNSGRFPP
jgi:hypothetical protein